jgi:hypothetical protein
MNTVTILNVSDFTTPSVVQSAIKDFFAFSKNKEVEVRFDKEEKSFDIYQNDKYICSFDENGNEI